jgi:hypothetical protein
LLAQCPAYLSELSLKKLNREVLRLISRYQ